MSRSTRSTETTELRSFDASLPMALLQARENAMRLFRPLLADYELTEQQWRVLRALRAADGLVDAGELAERTFLLAPSLSRMLSSMETRMLISRTVDPEDQRRSLIALSPEGAELVRQVGPHSEERYALIEKAFGSERLANLLGELHELAGLDLDSDDEVAR